VTSSSGADGVPVPGPIVGIDLGTTLSAVAKLVDGRVRMFENPLGDVFTPSAVAIDPRSRSMVVGRTAKDILAAHPGSGQASFKRVVGEDRPLSVGERSFTPTELSAYVLDALRADAERALETTVNRCVVTVPAYFSEGQRAATQRAAEMAGFTVERVLNEPTAAAIAYGLHRRDDESRFLVFDLGGGTFDVCVMELFEGTLQVQSVAGVSRLGGDDFTQVLAEAGLERAGIAPAALARDPDATALLHRRAELLKRKLTRWRSAGLEIPPIRGVTASSTTVEIDREQAERAWAPLLDQLVGPCRAALRGAEMRPDELDEIVLVGGATRMPCIPAFVERTFGRAPLIDPEPDRLVTRGAAIQAALCADDDAVEDMVVTDVASHSLGVSVTRQIGGKQVDGYFSPILHRNTVIPASRTESYSTVADDQTKIRLRVYEGESRRVEENTLVGDVEVSDIPDGPAGQEILVTFTYDLNGMLEVRARVVATGTIFSAVFNRSGRDLDEAELDRAKKRLQALRSDPAERPRYRDALARADLLWKELPPDGRSELEWAITQFESALAEREAKPIEQAYEALIKTCERLDGGERW
jgi:molecular chaperone HscC